MAVTVVLAHDARALRISGALGPTPAYLSEFGSFDAGALPPLFKDINAKTPIIVVHVLGEPSSGTSLLERLRSTHAAILGELPGAENLRQWVLQLAGTTWDHPERESALSALAAAEGSALRGVLVTARSCVEFLHQPEEEELVTGRDVLWCLVQSPDLEMQLSQTPRVLLVGTTSVTFDVGLSRREEEERRLKDVLVQLVREPSAVASDEAAGRVSIEQLQLSSDDEQLRMLSGPDGGSLLVPLAFSRSVFTDGLDDVDIADWPTVVGAAVEELRGIRVRRALKDLARGRDQRIDELTVLVDLAVLDTWDSSGNVHETALFVRGMSDALATSRNVVLSKRPDTLPADPGPALERLRRYARHFPFPAAVALRFGLLATATVLLLTAPLVRLLALSDARDRLVARLGAVLVVLLAALVLQTRWRRLVRARNAALEAAEDQAKAEVQRAAVDARVTVHTALIEHLQTWTERLELLRLAVGAVEEPRSAEPDPLASRLSATLVRQAPERPVQPRDDQAAVVSYLRGMELRLPVGVDLLASLRAALNEGDGDGGGDLAAFLRSSPTARAEAVRVLSQDPLPVIGDQYAELQMGQIRRFFCLPGGEDGGVASLLLEELRIRQDAVLGSADVNSATALHLHEADFVAQGAGE